MADQADAAWADPHWGRLYPGSASIDVAAIGHNLGVLQQSAPTAQQMVVLKGDAYGHGLRTVALAAHQAGVRWFGAAQASEALQVRRVLDEVDPARAETRVLTWLARPGADWRPVLAANIDVSTSSVEVLQEVAVAADELRGSEQAAPARAATAGGAAARVHLKADTGMSRGGATWDDWPALLLLARELADSGKVTIAGIWSHLACADDPSAEGQAATQQQIAKFCSFVSAARDAGIQPEVRHLAATAGALWHPQSHFDLVRIGIGAYGLSPNPARGAGSDLGLRPVMSLHAPLVQVKRLHAGQSVSYGGTWTAEQDNWVGVVPLGYADGIPRQASGRAQVDVAGQAANVLGRICMDQMVVDLGTADEPRARVGDEVGIFGGGPVTADDWACAADTINYEITTGLAARVPRRPEVAE